MSARSLLAWLVLFLVGCGKLTIGPFPPTPPRICGADPDCPAKQGCRYPAPSSKQAVCMPTGWNEAEDFDTSEE